MSCVNNTARVFTYPLASMPPKEVLHQGLHPQYPRTRLGVAFSVFITSDMFYY
jgi:hypothetical protein